MTSQLVEMGVAEARATDGALMDDLEWLRKVFRKVLQDMKIMKPHYYVIFKEFFEHLRANGKGNILIDGDRVDVEVVYGFYSGFGRRLGITRNAVKQRLKRAIKWAIRRARWYRGRE